MNIEGARGLLALPDEDLLKRASALREKAAGGRVGLCAIINIKSGQCAMDCAFCGQSGHVRNGPIYPLMPDSELWDRLRALLETPVNRVGLVAAGKSLSDREFARLIAFFSRLPESAKSRICVSLGQLDAARIARLRAAGIASLHHNLETSREFYPKICSTQDWLDRRETVKTALAAGMRVCSGAIFGVGETWEDRIKLALELSSLGVKNIPLNFLDPRPGSALASATPLSRRKALKIIALFRLILPDASLRVCGGRKITFGERQADVFKAGADALMTGDFLTTKGQALTDDLNLVAACGLAPLPARA